MKIEVLDNGYVEFIEAWGTGKAGKEYDPAPDAQRGTPEYAASCEQVRYTDYECGIIEAARQSTQGAFRGWSEDSKLLARLRNNVPPHSGPFEFAGMTIEVQAPIFVFREWHRHRTQSYNEMSARYAPLPDLCYLPDRFDVIERSVKAEQTRNKQEAGTAPFNPQYVDKWLSDVEIAYNSLERIYQKALANGIPKELARITMPVGHYSRMRASGNLRNWLAFLTLRRHPDAQAEIRHYAYAVGTIIERHFPQTWRLFDV